MSEKEMSVFAEMFGSVPKKAEKPVEAAPQKNEEPKTEETKPAEPEKPEEQSEKKDGDEGVDAKALADAKKELGVGGAAFCDELLSKCPDAFARLKEAKKTLHGFYNYAYSYALDEYVRKNGRVNGGGYWELDKLLDKYLDPSVAEGFTVKEPKAKPAAPKPASDAKAKTEAVKKVAKKAAKAAKKAAEKPKSSLEEAVTVKPAEKKSLFAGIDFSKISFS